MPPDDLPLFPLGLVLFPGQAAPLHIFEPRYRELVRYCLEVEEPFGIVLAEGERLAEVGCTARIERVLRRHDDGRLDILVRGGERFRLGEVRQERAYLTARVEAFRSPGPGEVDAAVRERVITLHMKHLELSGEPLRPNIYEGAREVSFVVAQNAGLDLAGQQEVLATPTEQARLALLAAHLERVIPELEREREQARRIRSNGHLKES